MAYVFPEAWTQQTDGFSTNTRRNAVTATTFTRYGWRPRNPSVVFRSDEEQAWYFTGTGQNHFLHGDDVTVTGSWTNPNARKSLPMGDIDLEIVQDTERVTVPWSAFNLFYFYNTAGAIYTQLRIATYDESDVLLSTYTVDDLPLRYVPALPTYIYGHVIEEPHSRVRIYHNLLPTTTSQPSRNPYGFGIGSFIVADFHPHSLRQKATQRVPARQVAWRESWRRQRQISF